MPKQNTACKQGLSTWNAFFEYLSQCRDVNGFPLECSTCGITEWTGMPVYAKDGSLLCGDCIGSEDSI